MKLLLFSDLHLDASFTLGGVARRRREGLRQTLESILHAAIKERVDAILCGGDLYEQERFTPDTAGFLRASFEKVHPLPVYIAPGNHDWYGPRSLYLLNEWSSNVHIFDSDRLTPVTLGEGLTLWGAAHRSPVQTANFLRGFKVQGSGCHVALFHGSETGSTGLVEAGKDFHGPFRVEDISLSGFRHAFLGHYHRPRHDDNLTYPGNPEPLTFGEDGERGAVLVEISCNGELTRRTLDVAATRVREREIDLGGCSSGQDALQVVRSALENERGVVRLSLHGDVPESLDVRASDFERLGTSLDTLVVQTDRLRPSYDFELIARDSTVRGQFVRDVLAADLDEDCRRRVLLTGLRALDGRDDLEVE
jgi:DNA repair exonuclease SbcCD nuclease subunit